MKVKVGIIGLGWFGNFHLDQLLLMEDVEVVALCTANTEKIKMAHAKVPEAKCFSHHQEMFEEMDLDAVYICVTPSRHEDIEILAAQKGIAMYIEKPIGLDLEQVNQIEKAIIKAGVIHSIGYQERYSEGITIVRKWMEDERVPLVIGSWIDQMPEALWWRQKKLSGGQVVEQATHIVDMFRFLYGEFQPIAASAIEGMIEKPDYDLVDASNTLLHFDCGMSGSLFCGCYLNGLAQPQIGFTLYGTSSKLEYIWNQKIRITNATTVDEYELKGNSHYRSSRAFIEAVRKNDQSYILSSYTDARKTLETTILIADLLSGE